MGLSKLDRTISYIEELKFSFFSGVLSFLSIVLLRNFLEGALENEHSILKPGYFFNHFLFFWIAIFLTLALILHLLSRERIERVSKTILVFWPIIMLPPILDFFFSGTRGYDIKYCFDTKDFFQALGGFFCPFVRLEGITYGMRVEVLVVCILTLLYVVSKTKRLLKGFLTIIIVYFSLSFYYALPLIFPGLMKRPLILGGGSKIANSGLFEFTSGALWRREIISQVDSKFSLVYLFLIVILSSIYLYLYNRDKFLALFKNIRPTRTVHFLLMGYSGMLLGYKLSPFAGQSSFFDFSSLLITLALGCSVFFAFQCAALVNDIFDIRIDRISNRVRPLVVGAISSAEAKILSVIFFLFSLSFAVNINYSVFILILICINLSLIYSLAPLRIKRFFPLSIFGIALANLMVMMAGFSIFAGVHTPGLFPPKIALLVLLVFFISGSVKDIKDAEGDREEGIYTIPTILGLARGKRVIGLLVLLSYCLVSSILGVPRLMIPSLLWGVASLAIITRKRTRENILFFLYFGYLVLVLFVLVSDIELLRPKF